MQSRTPLGLPAATCNDLRARRGRDAQRRSGILQRACAALTLAAAAYIGAAAAAPVTVVEFYNASLDHYFLSPLAADIQALDSGHFPGWTRTGYNFTAFADAASAPSGDNPVCRFLIPPEHGDSHFFSASPTECAAVLAKIATDPNYSGYIEETPAAFYIALPDTTTGACPLNTIPVYRLWNQRADSNHRYTTDNLVRTQMIALGYAPEGYGPLSVAMCALSAVRGDSQVRVSSTSPFTPGCDGVAPSGTLFTNTEVEPMIAADPLNPMHVIGVWQQDRWSNGGSAGLRTGASFDGGLTWSLTQPKLSRCAGGNAGNGADYARASDPWITIAPDGAAHQISISFNGGTFQPGSSSAVLTSRSTDGGQTWTNPITLIRDTSQNFNDKESITADPTDANFVYAVWDRLNITGGGPSYFARTTNAGLTWEAARSIYDPGTRSQTLNNQIVGLPDGTALDFFNQFDSQPSRNRLTIIRSPDKGATWSPPTYIADVLSVGAIDPATGTAIRDAADLGMIATSRNGAMAVVWQDARFTGGARDQIAFSRSLDGGVTWSPPARINSVATTQAFIPSIAIRGDGTTAVTYYDMRNNVPAPGTLTVDAWFTTSADGVTWTERHLSGPFNFDNAPLVEDGAINGLFIGDYQGLAVAGDAFVPLFVRTNASTTNRTDVLASYLFSPALASDKSAAGAGAVTHAQAAPPLLITPELQTRLQETLRRALARRLHGWTSPAPPPAR